MARYRKIDVSINQDAKFNSVSVTAQWVFFRIISHNNLTGIGALKASLKGLAEEFKCDEKIFEEAFLELVKVGIVRFDKASCLIWIKSFLKYNKPESANVVKSWDYINDCLPECEFRNKIYDHTIQYVKTLGKSYEEMIPPFFFEHININDVEQKDSSQDSGEGSSEAYEEASEKAMPNQITNNNNKEQEQYLKTNVELETRPRGEETDVQKVFKFWQEVMDHPKAKLDRKREGRIKAALKVYSLEDICKAITGCSCTPFNMGDNDRRQKYNDIELILRDAPHIDRFIGNFYRKPVKKENSNLRTALENGRNLYERKLREAQLGGFYEN